MKKAILLVSSFVFLIALNYGNVQAVPLVIPSSFPLHRPLNPALITRINTMGLSFGVGEGNRDLLNQSKSNCELKGFTSCRPDKSDSVFAYFNYDESIYFQFDTLRVQKTERDYRDYTKLNFNQFEFDSIASVAFQFDFISFGISRRDTFIRLREYFSDPVGYFVSKQKEESIVYKFGAFMRFHDWFFISAYRDTPAYVVHENKSGRSFESTGNDGFSGGGLGFRIDMGGDLERPDEFLFELFILNTKSPVTEDEAQLAGFDFEAQIYSFVFYALIIGDMKNNYFYGELLRDGSTSFATGIGWNGEYFQISAGRDPRFFTGIDGGVIINFGLQF